MAFTFLFAFIGILVAAGESSHINDTIMDTLYTAAVGKMLMVSSYYCIYMLHVLIGNNITFTIIIIERFFAFHWAF